MNIFSLKETENIFEIGRIIQFLLDNGLIDIEDSKYAFDYAFSLAVEFEKEYPETEEYYTDISEFATKRILDEFKIEGR